jgi:hypothetical protein
MWTGKKHGSVPCGEGIESEPTAFVKICQSQLHLQRETPTTRAPQFSVTS